MNQGSNCWHPKLTALTRKRRRREKEEKEGGITVGEAVRRNFLRFGFCPLHLQGNKDSSKLTACETALLSFSQLESPVYLQSNNGHHLIFMKIFQHFLSHFPLISFSKDPAEYEKVPLFPSKGSICDLPKIIQPACLPFHSLLNPKTFPFFLIRRSPNWLSSWKLTPPKSGFLALLICVLLSSLFLWIQVYIIELVITPILWYTIISVRIMPFVHCILFYYFLISMTHPQFHFSPTPVTNNSFQSTFSTFA